MNQRILLVEDDDNDVFFMRSAMKKAGVLVPLHVAMDGQKALDYLAGTGEFANREEFPLPCLVLLDLKLPHVMGLDVLKWIRQTSGLAIPVIVLTSSKNPSDIEQAYRFGANAYLVKPAPTGRLQEIVNSIKDFWLIHNTPPL